MVPAMTANGTTTAAGAGPPAGGTVWRAEMADTLRLAAPLALTQLGHVAMMTTDLALLGRLGDRIVAAAALAQTVLFAAFMVGMGLVSAVAPLASQAFGARRPRMVRRSVRVGLWAALLAGVPLTALQLWGGEAILLALGQPRDTAELAGRYLAGLSWCLIPSWTFIALRNFMSAVNRPEPGLWITLWAIPVNAALGYALIYGTLGAPRLGILGAGVATTLVNVAMCAAAVWFAYARRPFKKFQVLGRFWRADWTLLRRLLVVGVPISAAFLLEFGMFAAASLLMGSIGCRRAGRARHRAADGGDPVHGPVRHLARRHGARRPGRRAPGRGRHAPRWFCRDLARRGVHGGHDPGGGCLPPPGTAAVPGRRGPGRGGDGGAGRHPARRGRHVLRHRRPADGRRRCPARPQ
jgi:Na+-driven multidrug efflux pump